MIRTLEALTLVGILFFSRLLPHPPNTTLTGSVALYSYERFGAFGFLIPFTGLILSDLFIGLYDWRLLVSVYVSFGLYFLLGRFVSSTSHPSTIALTSVTASTLFFLITNTAVWALSSWYPHNAAGLLACLAAGFPFYRNMLFADIVGAIWLFKTESVTLFGTTLKTYDHRITRIKRMTSSSLTCSNRE